MQDCPIIHNGGKARGIFSSGSEKMTLLRGSQLSIDLTRRPSSNIVHNYESFRDYLKTGAVVRFDGLRVERDIPYVSLSATGVFESGKPGSGWLVWLLEDGRPLDDLRKKDASPLPTPSTESAKTPLPMIVGHIVLERAKSLKHLAEVRDEIRSNPHSRWLSWNHCYEFFRQTNVAAEKQHAALHLGFYLASWGMLRNSKLLNKNHLFHEPLAGSSLPRRRVSWSRFRPALPMSTPTSKGSAAYRVISPDTFAAALSAPRLRHSRKSSWAPPLPSRPWTPTPVKRSRTAASASAPRTTSSEKGTSTSSSLSPVTTWTSFKMGRRSSRSAASRCIHR
jgi:hypothetical protein